MNFLRVLFATLLVFGTCIRAKADDFQMIVIDPQFTVVDVTTTTFTFQFSACDTGQAPAGYAGCFTGENLTGGTIVGLSISVPNLIPNTTGGGNQPAGCDTTISQTFFTSCSTQNLSNGYILTFSGGNIPSDQFLNSEFTIAEQGADPAEFGTMTATATLASTPEPDSLILLATGMLSTGGYLLRRRRANRS